MEEEVLKKLWEVEMEILDEVHRICVENSLKYYICGGTLLGSVRHQGFIPWDDDIDIQMPVNDYRKFLHLCQNGALGGAIYATSYINRFELLSSICKSTKKEYVI